MEIFCSASTLMLRLVTYVEFGPEGGYQNYRELVEQLGREVICVEGTSKDVMPAGLCCCYHDNIGGR